MRLFLFILFFSPALLNAQEYWQQEVKYKIDVKLNDVDNTLSAYEEFEYVNNSPNTLDTIYIHLWPNAYNGGKSALSNQQYKEGDNQLRHISEKDRGYIDSLDFKVNGKKVKWHYHSKHEDIAYLILSEKLGPNERLLVSTPFKVKIPSGAISRLGHVEQSFQITQWYPKPAVYDKDGWHEMPYLGQGEFYSEYGSFDVSITLPKNYVVGATGDLQTKSEMAFLNLLSEETNAAIKEGSNYRSIEGVSNPNDFPESSAEMKTIRYKQSNVHDFAWFADKRFSVLKSEVELPHSKKMVTSWAMYTPKNADLWTKSSEYLNDAIYYYSLWNGDYPYKQVTAVDGTISAGGGMEYPNVTVIGNTGDAMSLEVVIVHEVGHNWFYGQLGSNERVHGWMDEGMNTLNEIRYVQTKYPNNTNLSDMVLNGRFHLNDLCHHDMADISYRAIAGLGEDQPIETHSAEFTPTNYGIIMYQKTGLVFYYLKDYLGDELFDKCMYAYYNEWEFKHPQPQDMQNSLEASSGKNLDWLFHDLIKTTNHIDYKITKAVLTKRGYLVKTKNVGQVDGPIEINGIRNDSVVVTAWIEPGNKSNEIILQAGHLDKVVIDDSKDIPEIHRQNNTSKAHGLFKKFEPIKFEMLFGDNEKEYTNVFWTPMISWNLYDKMMLGVVLHNYSAPTSRFNYLVAPSYSFGRKMISGISELSYTFLPVKNLKSSKFGLSVKSFKNDSIFRDDESHFISIAPYWQAKIGDRKKHSRVSQYVRLQTIYKKDRKGSAHIEHAGAFVEYNLDFKKPDHKVNFKLRNEYMSNVNSATQIGRVMIESTYEFRYLKNKMNRWAELRVFAGQQYLRKFPFGGGYNYSMSMSGSDGRQDLFVEEYNFGRSESTGMWSQQRNENMGGFKSTSTLGTTSVGMATANVYVQMPVKLLGFLGVFADFGTYHDGLEMNSAVNTGIGIRLGDVLGIYFPVWMSENLENSYTNLNYAERIRFTLKFNVFNKPLSLGNLF